MTDYKLLCEALRGFIETDTHYIPVMSNAPALLYDALPDLNWAGFYIVRPLDAPGADAAAEGAETAAGGVHLVVGPFQGKPACIHIAMGKGVCGTAAASDTIQLVPDVHKFPGHIACDSASNSEIVIPIHRSVAAASSGSESCCSAASGPAVSQIPGAAEAGCASEPVASQTPGAVAAVLDIDSPLLGRFSQADAEGLQQFVRVLEEGIVWG